MRSAASQSWRTVLVRRNSGAPRFRSRHPFILGLETVAAQASYIGRSELMENRVPSVDEEIARIDAVTPAEVDALAERLLTGGVQALSEQARWLLKVYIPYILYK